MESNRFDRLVMALAVAETRRGIVRLLGALPFVGGLATLLSEDETFADGRRRRHKKPHKHKKRTGNRAGKRKKQTGKKKHPDKGCKAESHAATCAGKCGPVKNTCNLQKTVDCGSCACDPPCEICQTCQGEPGECLQDAPGTPCGDPGQVCQGDGSCACEATSCPSCTTCGGDGACEGCAGCCDGDQCVASCGACQVCDDGQCTGCPNCCDANSVCKPGNITAACGSSGSCDECTGQEQCQNRQCVCVPDCGGKICGPDGCGDHCGSGCPPNATCTNEGTACVCAFRKCDDTCCGQANAICHTSTGACCVAESVEQICNGQCGDVVNNCGIGVDCGSCTCSPACPICQTCDTGNGECVNVSNSEPCGDGLHCKKGQCVCDSTSCPNGCCDAQGQCQIRTADVCGSGGVTCVTCNQCGDFCDEGICQGGSCDCAGLDGCSGHGCCTDTCACVCVAPWTGANCSELPQPMCADFETCEECSAHATDLGCVRCSDTFDGEFTSCVAAIECFFAVESCQ